MAEQKLDFSIKMEDGHNSFDDIEDAKPWPTLPHPLPVKGQDFPPKEYYVITFLYLPPVHDLIDFRDQMVYKIKCNLPAELKPPLGQCTIREENVFVDDWNEFVEKRKRSDGADLNGNKNIQLHTNMYVPVLTVGEGQALIDYWHGLDYYGKKLEVFFSTDYGRQLEQ